MNNRIKMWYRLLRDGSIWGRHGERNRDIKHLTAGAAYI